ncbi:MAG: ubiquitin-like protein Pup [Actinomycetes bacterium]
MSERDSEQQRVNRSTEESVDEVPTAGGVAERKEALDSDVDSILDEIDEVLEENAEEFVKSFVQKGGQ